MLSKVILAFVWKFCYIDVYVVVIVCVCDCVCVCCARKRNHSFEFFKKKLAHTSSSTHVYNPQVVHLSSLLSIVLLARDDIHAGTITCHLFPWPLIISSVLHHAHSQEENTMIPFAIRNTHNAHTHTHCDTHTHTHAHILQAKILKGWTGASTTSSQVRTVHTLTCT